MQNPYEILGLKAGCDDETVRRAYLEKTRRFTPEHSPEEFQLISRAYEMLKTRKKRIEFFLFDQDPGAESPLDCLRETRLTAQYRQPLPLDEMRRFLKQCLKN